MAIRHSSAGACSRTRRRFSRGFFPARSLEPLFDPGCRRQKRASFALRRVSRDSDRRARGHLWDGAGLPSLPARRLRERQGATPDAAKIPRALPNRRLRALASPARAERKAMDPDPSRSRRALGRRQPAPDCARTAQQFSCRAALAHSGTERSPAGAAAAAVRDQVGQWWLSLLSALTGATRADGAALKTGAHSRTDCPPGLSSRATVNDVFTVRALNLQRRAHCCFVTGKIEVDECSTKSGAAGGE